MALSTEQHTSTDDQQSGLDAQIQLWNHTFGYVRSMALKAALDLRIPDAIHEHGSPATLPQIVAKVTLHPSKIPCLRRLMRVLTVTGVFSAYHSADGGELLYGLTPVSGLLVGPLRMNVSPFLTLLLDPIFVTPFLGLGEWFHEMPDPSLLKMTHERDLFDLTDHNASFGKLFDNGMAADSGGFIMDIVVKECSNVFQGISSLVDVAGGVGAATQIIAEAFPHVECSVLDLSHVVACAPVGTNVRYFTGDMFDSIPSANVIFLKDEIYFFAGLYLTTHVLSGFILWSGFGLWSGLEGIESRFCMTWDDADCVKILKNCKKAIPGKEGGGKVIILDIVVGAGSSDQNHVETQVLFDLSIMSINGAERDEQEWNKIIFEAGFNDYKIIPALRFRSIIEAYP